MTLFVYDFLIPDMSCVRFKTWLFITCQLCVRGDCSVLLFIHFVLCNKTIWKEANTTILCMHCNL